MYDIADDVARWLDDGQDPTVALVVDVRGLSAGTPATAWAWLPGGPSAGRPLAGLDGELPGRGVVHMTVSDAQAATLRLDTVAVQQIPQARRDTGTPERPPHPNGRNHRFPSAGDLVAYGREVAEEGLRLLGPDPLGNPPDATCLTVR